VISRGHVWLVGAGPGDPGLLTLKAARAIERCDVLVYDYLASTPIVALASPQCERIYVGKKAGAHTMRQEDITALIVRLGHEGKRVVRLKGGDPFVFGRGGEEAAELRAAGVSFEIVPGITSAIAAPAYAGIPITHRDHNTAFTVATGHEDPAKTISTLDFAKLADPHQTLVLLMAMGNLAGIVEQLRANGLAATTPIAIVREGTKPTQQTLVATLETVVADVARVGIGAPAIVIIGDVVREREAIGWFDRGPLFGKRVLLTRPLDQSHEVAERLWEAGAEPLVAPVIAIGPPDDPADAMRAVDAIRSYTWVVFSSRNGVDAFFERLDQRGRDARAFGDVKVAAIGPKTAAALATRGIYTDFVPDSAIGEAVAAGVIERTTVSDRVLIFRAQEARDVLRDALRASGRVVDIVAAYATTLVHDPAIAEHVAACDIVTLTSASTVAGLLANVDVSALRDKHVACIGPVTAAAARAAGLAVNIIADEYTVDGLVDALVREPLAVS